MASGKYYKSRLFARSGELVVKHLLVEPLKKNFFFFKYEPQYITYITVSHIHLASPLVRACSSPIKDSEAPLWHPVTPWALKSSGK